MNARLAERLERARAHAARGEVIQAETLFVAALRDDPRCADAAQGIALLALEREDWERAVAHFAIAHAAAPGDQTHLMAHVEALWRAGRNVDAIERMTAHLAEQPGDSRAWLQLGQMHEALHDPLAAARARFQAITTAQRAGRWLDTNSTEPQLVEVIKESIASLHVTRREYLLRSFEDVRQEFGARELSRVEHALLAYLGEVDALPPDARQRPTFFYFPGLPDLPYHDPMLQPWATSLTQAWQAIRDEAAALISEGAAFEDFLGLQADAEKSAAYVGGDGPAPAWDAFFFYRHGERYDANHARCPRTSAVLESIELCRIAHQAPEICFSLLRPGSTIMAHHGVTNTRLVMHLPLIVPPDCALNVVDAGEHHWVPGQLMMFDDTYRHEAWNRSAQTRVVLLMDCWNPHLTPPEKAAVKWLVEAIDAFEKPPGRA